MALTYNHKRRILYVGTETAAGTYAGSATLFVVGNATLPADSIKFSPNVAFTERDPDGPSLQPIAAVPGQASGKISFNTRFIGTSALGVIGPLDKLLEPVLLASIATGVSVTYKFNPSSVARLSIGYGTINENGTLELEHAIAGAGPSKLTIKADGIGKPVMVDWEFEGKIAYDTGVPVAIDDATPDTGITFVDDATLGYRFLGLTVTSGLLSRTISKFEFDLGIKGSLGNDVADPAGHDYWKLEGCNPVLKIDPSKVSVATANDLANMISGAKASAGFTATSPGGGKFSLAIPALQPTSMSDDSVGPVSTWGISASARRVQDGTTVDSPNAFSITLA